MEFTELERELGERVVKFGMPIGPEIARDVLRELTALGYEVVKTRPPMPEVPA